MSNTRIVLLRHGLTPWNAEGRWQGQEDVPLTEEGFEQARLVADRLITWEFDAIYSSDLIRARDTALAVVNVREESMEIIEDARFRERHAGEFQGLVRDDIAESFPEKLKELEQGIIAPEGGESAEEFQDRVAGGFHDVVSRHEGEQILIVSHGGTIRASLASVLNVPEDEIWKFSLGNTALCRLEKAPRGYQIGLWNDTSHLDGVKTTNPAWGITL